MSNNKKTLECQFQKSASKWTLPASWWFHKPSEHFNFQASIFPYSSASSCLCCAWSYYALSFCVSQRLQHLQPLSLHALQEAFPLWISSPLWAKTLWTLWAQHCKYIFMNLLHYVPNNNVTSPRLHFVRGVAHCDTLDNAKIMRLARCALVAHDVDVMAEYKSTFVARNHVEH